MTTRTKKMLMMVAAVAAMLAPNGARAVVQDGIEYDIASSSLRHAYLEDVSGTFVLPSVIDGCTMEILGSRAVKQCQSLTGLVISEGVKIIEDEAIFNCIRLSSLTIPEGVEMIWNAAFSYNHLLQEGNVHLPDRMEISYNAFWGTRDLKNEPWEDNRYNTTLVPHVRVLDGWIFGFTKDAGDVGLIDLDLRGKGLRGFCEYAFAPPVDNHGYFIGGGNIASIVIPGTMKAVNRNAFHGSSNLKKVVIEEGVESINENAFRGTSIESITIPATVTHLEKGAFFDCDNLERVVFEGDAPTVSGNPFRSGTKIYVKPGTTGWGYVPCTWNGCSIGYEPKDVNVTFQFNYSGGGSGTTKTIKSDEPVLPYAPEVPARKGFEFVGWFTAPTGGEQINSSTTTETDAAYYAHWEPTTITVTLDPNFPGGLHFSRETYTLDRGDSLHDKIGKFWDTDIPAYTTQTHDFLGFFTAPDGGSLVTRYVVPTGDVTYYGHWAIKRYSVYFDPNGGTGGGWVTFDHGDKLVGPNTPVREGYEFWGWSLSTGGLTAIPKTVTADATYYAAWKRPGGTASCALALKPNNTKYGTVSGGGTYAYGSKATLKAKAKSGYVFAGWFKDKSCKKPLNPDGYDNRNPTVKYTMSAQSTTIYAKFVTKAEDKKALKFSSATAKLAKTAAKATAGAAFSLKLGVSSSSLPAFTAKGLPKGLKIDKATGEITGTGTVPGSYTATVTVKDAAGNGISQKVKFKVSAPSWATGTFYGTAKPDGKTAAYLQFSVGSTGKVSGKVNFKGKAYSFTSAYKSCTSSKATFAPSVKVGSSTFKPGAVTVKEETLDGLALVEASNSKGTFAAQKKPNLVKKGKALAALVGKTFKFTKNDANSGLTKSKDTLTVKLAKGDAVTVSGTVKGKTLKAISWVTLVSGKSTADGITTYTLYVDIIDAALKYAKTLVITATAGPDGATADAKFAK